MIAFYISSHGFGHLTRCLGHIEKYLLETNYNIYIVCGEKQIEFAKKYLNKYSVNRTSFKSMVTDIGLINKENSLEVDKENPFLCATVAILIVLFLSMITISATPFIFSCNKDKDCFSVIFSAKNSTFLSATAPGLITT